MPFKDKKKLYAAQKRYRQRRKTKQQDALFYSYFAGIIDGEGSLGLYKHKAKAKDHPLGFNYQPQLVIVNTDSSLLEYLSECICTLLLIKPSLRQFERVGGFVSPHTHEKYAAKPIYELRFRTMWQLQRLLQAVIPYLFSKNKIAELVLQFCTARLNRPSHKATYSEGEHALYEEIKSLSSRRQQRKW